MSTKAGTGFSANPDSFAAAREAATAALIHGGLARCDLLLVFATSRHDSTAFLAGLRAVAPEARVLGGSAIGAITNCHLGYDGYQVAVGAFEWGDVRAEILRTAGLADREMEAGDAMGSLLTAILSESGWDGSAMLLMYDSMNHQGATPKMNMATPFLRGLNPHLPANFAFAGIGQCGDTPRDAVTQWFDDTIEDDTAQALLLSGNVRLDTVVMHGCRPAGSYREVTKSEGAVVLELDGRPALEVIAEMLGPDSGYSVADYRFFVTLGVNKGDRFGPYREEDYANRLCCGVDEARGGLVMFEPDLVPGTQVQLMRRSLDFDYIGKQTRDLLGRLGDRQPFFALYIDCAGRAAAYCGSESEEAAEVQRAIGEDIPLLGVYCGVEVARVGAELQPLDWSGVLCVFSQKV